MTLAPVLAHGGWSDIFRTFEITGAVTVIVVSAVVVCVAALALRDLFRFGRDGSPWLVAAGAAALFGGVGFWAGGLLGALFGAPVLIAFGSGRYAAYRKRIRHD